METEKKHLLHIPYHSLHGLSHNLTLDFFSLNL